MKYKKIGLFFTILFLIYFLIVLNGKKIETYITFSTLGIKDNNQKIKNLKFEEIKLINKNGEEINGLYLKGKEKEVIYYFHGNGELKSYYGDIKYLHGLGYSVISYDYPYYGEFNSFNLENNQNNFSFPFFSYLKEEKKIKNDTLILLGDGIGAVNALDFASKNDYKNLILVSSFGKTSDLFPKYGLLVKKIFFLNEIINNNLLVKNLKKPVLFLHGNNNNEIHFDLGEKLFKNYSKKAKKYFIEVDGAGNNNIFSDYGNELRYFIYSFIKGEDFDFKTIKIDHSNKEKYIKKGKKILGDIHDEFDFLSDDSITKFISNNVSFNKLDYIPNDLEKISSEYIVDKKGNQLLRKEAKDNLEGLGKDFFKKFQEKLIVISAYRSYEAQLDIKKGGCIDKFCAKQGHSEHQSGLAVDLFEASSNEFFLKNEKYKKYFSWLKKNAYKYGFINSYRYGFEVDGYDIEPWHWRYVGEELAKKLQKKDINFIKYYNNLNKKNEKKKK